VSAHAYYFEGSVSWLGVLGLALFLWLVVRILHKAGFSGWWALLMLVPVINIVAVWLFGFSDWPSGRNEPAGYAGWPRPAAARLRELDALHRQGLIGEEEYAERRKAILDAI